MVEIGNRRRLSEKSPPILSPLVNKLGYNGMTDWGDYIIKGEYTGAEMGDSNTITFLKHLKLVAGYLLDPETPITIEDYIAEVNKLREYTSSGTSIITPAMVKTEALDQEFIDIVWRRFNSPWCIGYPPNRYRRGLYLLINRYPEDFQPHKLRPTILFNIDANLHNKQLVKLFTRRAEELRALAPEQYGSRKGKSEYTQALNTQLLYYIVRLKRVPVTRIF